VDGQVETRLLLVRRHADPETTSTSFTMMNVATTA